MKRIGLATYSIRFRDKHKAKKEGYCKFDKLPKDTTIFDKSEPQYYDAIDIIKEIFTEHRRFSDPARKVISDVRDVKMDGKRVIYGFLDYGDYGTPRTIVRKNDEKYKMDLTEDEGVENRFYFMFKLPKGQDMGILFLERKGHFGLKTLLFKWINKKLNEHQFYSRYAVDLDPLIDKRVFDKYIKEGKVRSLNFIKKTIPRDSFQKRKNYNGELQVKVKFKDKTYLRDIFEHVNFFDNKDKIARKEFLTFRGQHYDDLRLKIDTGNSPRTFRYENPEKSAPYLDITNELDAKDGNHSLKSIHTVAKKYEEEMISNIWRTD